MTKTLKGIKHKLQKPGTYREALVELARMQNCMTRLGVQDGDTVLFRLGDHSRMTNEMIRVFLDVASQRGLRDINAMLLKQGDSVATMGASAFNQFARMKGYVPEETPREVSSDAQERAVFLPVRDEERAGPRADEGQNTREGQAEGLRAEEQTAAGVPTEEIIAELDGYLKGLESREATERGL